MNNFSLDNDTAFEQCLLARAIIDPWYYRGIVIGECVAAFAAITPNILFLSIIWKVSVLPPNLRLLLGHLSLVFLWYSVGSIIKCLYILTVPICGFKLTSLECKILDLVSIVLVLPNLFYTVVALCIERLYATLRYKKYDKTAAKKPWLSFLLIVFSWLLAFGLHGNPILTMPNDEYIPTCESTFVPVKSAVIYEIYLFLEVISVAMTGFIYFYNRYVVRNMSINRARYDLSSRFQVDQNVRVNAIMISSMILHVLCHIPTFIAMVGVRSRIDITAETKAWLTQVTYLWRLVYAVAHPSLAFKYNDQFYQHLINGPFLKRLLINNKKVGNLLKHDRNGSCMQTGHFNFLQNQWDLQQRKSKPEKKPVAKF